jgi:hypothetical protein
MLHQIILDYFILTSISLSISLFDNFVWTVEVIQHSAKNMGKWSWIKDFVKMEGRDYSPTQMRCTLCKNSQSSFKWITKQIRIKNTEEMRTEFWQRKLLRNRQLGRLRNTRADSSETDLREEGWRVQDRVQCRSLIFAVLNLELQPQC